MRSWQERADEIGKKNEKKVKEEYKNKNNG